MTQRDDTVYVLHILDAIGQIEDYLRNLDYETYRHSRMVQDAVIRQLEIIGEATKNLSTEMKDRAPEIPWKNVAGMRDKLIHQYFGVDIASVWETAKSDLPELRKRLEQLL